MLQACSLNTDSKFKCSVTKDIVAFWQRTATYQLWVLLYYDVIDGNMNKFDEKANESHDSKTNGSGQGDLLKFCKQNKRIQYK